MFPTNGSELRYALAFVVALAMSLNGYKKGSLSSSGAAAAFATGCVSFAASYRHGVILILFYLTSSKLTKAGKERKMKMESDYGTSSRRSAAQVFGSSIFASIVALLYILLVRDPQDIQFPSKFHALLVDFLGSGMYLDILIYVHQVFVLAPRTGESQQMICALLDCLYIAHYACTTADTWASEVGILSRSPPRLITSLFLRTVPPGTNGGVSVLGTLVSGLGGLFIATIYVLMTHSVFEMGPQALFGRDEMMSNLLVLLFGMVCGVMGSLLDSLLGATCQQTLFSKDRRCIVKHRGNDPSVTVVCGVDILSNEGVNLVSTLLTMVLGVPVAVFMLSAHS